METSFCTVCIKISLTCPISFLWLDHRVVQHMCSIFTNINLTIHRKVRIIKDQEPTLSGISYLRKKANMTTCLFYTRNLLYWLIAATSQQKFVKKSHSKWIFKGNAKHIKNDYNLNFRISQKECMECMDVEVWSRK